MNKAKKKKDFLDKYFPIILIGGFIIAMSMFVYFLNTTPELAEVWNEAMTPLGLGDNKMNFEQGCAELNGTLEEDTCTVYGNESARYKYWITCYGYTMILYDDSKSDISFPKKFRDKCIIGREDRLGR